MNVIAQWSLRERLIVIIGALVLLLLGSHAFLWQPVVDERESLTQQIEQAKQDTAWIADNVARLQKVRKQTNKAINGSLVSWLDLQAQQYKLKNYLKRIKPSGAKQVKLDFKKAPSQDVFKLIKGIEQQGLTITRVKISADDQANLVNAQLTVSQP